MKKDRHTPKNDYPRQRLFLESYVETYVETYLLNCLQSILNDKLGDKLDSYKETIMTKCREAFQEGWLLRAREETLEKWTISLIVPIIAEEKGVSHERVEQWFADGGRDEP